MNIIMNQDGLISVQLESMTVNAESTSVAVDSKYSGDMGGVGMGEPTTTSKGSVMSSMGFVIGISTVTLAVSIVLGILLAKKRIKKGFDLYED
jgi:hypothetical protein